MIGNSATGTIVPNARSGGGIKDLFKHSSDFKNGKGASTSTVVPKKTKSILTDLILNTREENSVFNVPD